MKFIVREIIKEDLEILYKYVSDYEIAYLIDFDREMTYREFQERFEPYFSHEDDIKIFAIVLDNHVIGKMEIEYDLKNKTGIFDIMIGDKSYWGTGMAIKSLEVLFNYAFYQLNLNRLSCEVYRFNERSLNLMQKMKMQVEGVLREAKKINHQFVDICIFGILKKEFEGVNNYD